MQWQQVQAYVVPLGIALAVGALGASVVFVTVFAFCPLLDINIFNYALPYSHEATHGMLVMVGLIVAVGRYRPMR